MTLIILLGDMMKKIIILLVVMLLPLNVLAYSKYIIPGGDTLGIEVNSNGVVVVGFYQVDGEYINDNLKVGDRITEVNGNLVNTTSELSYFIEENMEDNKVGVTYYRNSKEYEDSIYLNYDGKTYRTGLYVKSNVLGIGTLTYIDPNSLVYGVLGHSLNMSNTNKKIDIREGFSYGASVSSFTRSVDGNPGSKNASIDKNKVFGTIESNTNYGIFGKVNDGVKREVLEVLSLDKVSLGEAYIRTTNLDNEIEDYKIKILDIDKNDSSKNIYFEIIDEELLDLSGGIVQGMSGSPILQDGKIIGAVTRVLVDDVNRGYGISIITMLEKGDELLEKQN